MYISFFPLLIISLIGVLVVFWRRYQFYSNMTLDEVIPLEGPLNKILLTLDSKTSMTVWSSSQRKLYKITRDKARWHIQSPSGKNLATVKYSRKEKYIVLAASSPVSNSPLLSTPSVIRMESNMFSSKNRYKESTFSFGTDTSLRWCGLNHFEIIGKCFGHPEGIQTLRQRVAFCEGVIENSFVILFDYDKINMEVLVSTFLLVLLCQGSALRKARTNESRYRSLRVASIV